MRRTILLLASMAVALVLASGVAFALVTFTGGGFIERVVIASETVASSSNSTVFVDIPGASVGVFVPSGTTRLISWLDIQPSQPAAVVPDTVRFGLWLATALPVRSQNCSLLQSHQPILLSTAPTVVERHPPRGRVTPWTDRIVLERVATPYGRSGL